MGQHESTRALAAREIVSSRVFAAPRARLFEAFSDPEILARWWGPQGFTNTFQEFEFRAGGSWRFAMRGPDGVDHPNRSRFLEITPQERIVIDHVSPPRFRMTIELADQAGKTKLTWRMLFETAAECDNVKKFIVPANEQNFDRLEAELAT